MREIAAKDYDAEKDALSKYAAEIDICVGDYNTKGKVNTDMGIFKFDFTYFMPADDLKKLAKDKLPEPLEAAKAFDFNQAERIYITKEELKRRELEEQER